MESNHPEEGLMNPRVAPFILHSERLSVVFICEHGWLFCTYFCGSPLRTQVVEEGTDIFGLNQFSFL